jgi:hypothetical protein
MIRLGYLKHMMICLWEKMPMRWPCDIHFELRGAGPSASIVALCGLLLTACMHAAPPMLTERTAMVSGRATTGLSANDATQVVLFKAAEMALDHGFRYFRITGANSVVADRSGNELIRPGANVTIKVYRVGEINPRATGIVDAQDIAEHMQTRVASMPAPVANTASSSTAPVNSGRPTPHCTVYGCVW